MNNLIRVEKLTKTFKLPDIEINVLKGIDIKVDNGDFISIMGPSGSGKTTLMNILGCLDIPSSGSYYFEGTEISIFNHDQLAEIRNTKIGFIFQSFNLLPRATALENAALPLIYNSNNNQNKEQLALKSLEMVGLTDRINHFPSQLSGGQQQRVAIARALINNPSMILADEPTGNLDSNTSDEILDILRKLNNEGKTIIMITHDNNVASVANRIIKIKDDKIIN